jgi:hypothetical protein
VYGGRLVFDHAAGIPTRVLTAEAGERAKGHEHAPGEGHDDGHSHAPARPLATDSGADTGGAGAPGGSDHVDPPGTPPHSHEKPETSDHTHPPGTPAHAH